MRWVPVLAFAMGLPLGGFLRQLTNWALEDRNYYAMAGIWEQATWRAACDPADTRADDGAAEVCVPVARHALVPGQPLGAQDLSWIRIPSEYVPKSAFRHFEEGLVVRSAVLPHELLRRERFGPVTP